MALKTTEPDSPSPSLHCDDCNAIIDLMASITIRNLDEETKSRLRVRAAQNGRSMEEEARTVLRQALAAAEPPRASLAIAINGRFRALGGVELELPAREGIRTPPKFR